jgi:hypothetical protein
MTPIAYAAVVAAMMSPVMTLPPARPLAPSGADAGATKIISGFRSARFHTTPAQVRRAIAADFPGLAIAERRQPSEGTTFLQLTVPALDPGPGPAVISYVFSATSRTLALVSVSWGPPGEGTANERQATAVAALRLGNYLRASTQPKLVFAPKVVRPGSVSLYGALDANGAGMELTATGIPYASKGDVDVPPTGVVSLRLRYMANAANPDVSFNDTSERR